MESTLTDELRVTNLVIDRLIVSQHRLSQRLMRAIEQRRRILRKIELVHEPAFTPADSLDQESAPPARCLEHGGTASIDQCGDCRRKAPIIIGIDPASGKDYSVEATYDTSDPAKYFAAAEAEQRAAALRAEADRITAMAEAEVNDAIAAFELSQTHDLSRWIDDGGSHIATLDDAALERLSEVENGHRHKPATRELWRRQQRRAS